MLIKDEETDNIILGDTLGDGKTRDGFQGRQFHYMLANPPFGVEWKDQQKVVEKEHEELGFAGRFGAGLPAINDGSLLFLQHMISKMHAAAGEGRRRLEDRHRLQWLAAVQRRCRLGAVQHPALDHRERLARCHRRPAGPAFLQHRHLHLCLARHQPQGRGAARQGAADRRHALLPEDEEEPEQQAQRAERRPNRAADARFTAISATARRELVPIDGTSEERVVSPHLREPGVRLPQGDGRAPACASISRRRPSASRGSTSNRPSRRWPCRRSARTPSAVEAEEAAGRAQQEAIRAMLATLARKGRYMDRDRFEADLDAAAKRAGLKLPAPIKKAIFAALGERDPKAEICRDSKGRPEPDSELRDTENIPSAGRAHGAAAADALRAGHAQRRAGRGDAAGHRRLYRGRSAAACARCLGRLLQDQGRLRNPDQPAFLRLQAAAPAGRDRGGHRRAGRRDCRAASRG